MEYYEKKENPFLFLQLVLLKEKCNLHVNQPHLNKK